MITRMLQRLGVFLGPQRDHHDESEFFLHLNQWLLRQSGGSWDYPSPVDVIIRRDEVRALYVDYLRYMVRTRGRVEFLGWRKALLGQNVLTIPDAWGWKDPRNTFTLPLWLDIFPDARVVHVLRHGVDVALSLHSREQKQLRQSEKRHERRKWLYWLRPKKNGFLDSPRCLSLPEALNLWDTYVGRASRHVDEHTGASHTLQYESFLQSPEDSLRELAAFCALDPTPSVIDECADRVDVGRAFAYRRASHLNLPENAAEVLAYHGYSL